MSPFIEGLMAGYGIAIPVGAVAILIINISTRRGFGIGFMAGAGAATADILYAIFATVMGTISTALLEFIALPLRILGGLLLAGLAASSLWQGVRKSSQSSKTAEVCGPLRMYAQFVGLTVVNPLTIVYFTAFILGRTPATASFLFATSLLFVAGVGLASLSWQTVLAGLGGIVHSRLAPRIQLATTVIGNLFVLVLGLRMLIPSVLEV